ncbi:bifunctional glutamate N-acetyltransferase/amino-acid acetyltransferase ArgJ [Siminovitchia fortis]|uniref:Arginine biosynthesis bifunctional protein ArgJ n=1 Tax=Siminovitchia fortis TaxID=254758 RepID=A0A443ISW3_9BACI|nr:bifunctional glutamate N-acetyltransferase/amino-acid acetyltransferase ArgJ [Siminovitchia fortis]RWR10073.1 bifunctional glutamate N-acetyltransferase/amino-acid acetyltransferase ArgJ [Siminovitchia fortis]WHY80710.1 bifunctional glutamate N-acetyltransferase/amino-acid acetyltransferase ArgJ [Siminovitchia fortis]
MEQILLPKGFYSCAKNLGIKDHTPDFTVIFSDTPAAAAAMFTKNQFCGAPVTVGKEHIKDGFLQAFVVNSKNANVATGKQGIQDVHTIIEAVAEELNVKPKDILPSSTGVIGVPLPVQKIVNGIPGIKSELKKDGLKDSAEAIMTTDTFAKYRSEKINGVTLCAIAKGSGMIEPDMATMLSYIMTDAKIDPDNLKAILERAVNASFNMVSVDGDTSTSDTVAAMANGLAGPVDLGKFETVLTDMLISLAKDLARDGEGATKLVEVRVDGAKDNREAKLMMKSIINSPLVKTAIFGADPNWGRIISTIGNAEYPINPEEVSVAFGDLPVFKNGEPAESSLEELTNYLEGDEIVISISLGKGSGKATGWGCDLSYDYVKINGEYTT